MDERDDEGDEQALDSLQASGISSSGPGWRVCPSARTMVRKAWASIARVTQRCQDVQRLTWYSSGSARPLPDRKVSSTVRLRPATRTRMDSGTWVAE